MQEQTNFTDIYVSNDFLLPWEYELEYNDQDENELLSALLNKKNDYTDFSLSISDQNQDQQDPLLIGSNQYSSLNELNELNQNQDQQDPLLIGSNQYSSLNELNQEKSYPSQEMSNQASQDLLMFPIPLPFPLTNFLFPERQDMISESVLQEVSLIPEKIINMPIQDNPNEESSQVKPTRRNLGFGGDNVESKAQVNPTRGNLGSKSKVKPTRRNLGFGGDNVESKAQVNPTRRNLGSKSKVKPAALSNQTKFTFINMENQHKTTTKMSKRKKSEFDTVPTQTKMTMIIPNQETHTFPILEYTKRRYSPCSIHIKHHKKCPVNCKNKKDEEILFKRMYWSST